MEMVEQSRALPFDRHLFVYVQRHIERSPAKAIGGAAIIEDRAGLFGIRVGADRGSASQAGA